MNLEDLVDEAKRLCAAENKNGAWAYQVCRKSTLLHEEVLESSPPADYVDEEILPVLGKLAELFEEVKPENLFARYIPGFLENVNWRTSELKKYMLKKKKKEEAESTVFSSITSIASRP